MKRKKEKKQLYHLQLITISQKMNLIVKYNKLKTKVTKLKLMTIIIIFVKKAV